MNQLDLTKHSKHYRIVRANSELELKDRYPGVFCVQRSNVRGYRGLWPVCGEWPNLITGEAEELPPMLRRQAS